MSPASLRFAATKNGSAGVISNVTAPQTMTVTLTGGANAWTASADQPWLQLANASGTGSGQFTVSVVNPNNVLAGSTSVSATITVSAPATSNGSVSVPVTLTIDQTGGATAAPFGQVDTPLQNATGVVGAIGVTGWALDDVGVASVQIYRNCLSFDAAASCQIVKGANVVFIGNAVFIAGARPDVEAAYATSPQASRAGWGFLLLINMLPHVPNAQGYGGQGPLTLYAFATDVEGHVVLLGRSTTDQTPTAIAMANDSIAKPFGAIDTPGQGATVSGGLVNFGWALTPDSNTTADGTDIVVPTNGSTVVVYVDGAAVSAAAYNQCRGTVGNPVPSGVFCNDDVASIFGNATPQAAFTTRTANATKYRNLDATRGPIGAYTIDTTTLTNGLHTIAWGVTDSAGRGEGIGSRFFTVLNTASDPVGVGATNLADGPAMPRGQASSLMALAQATSTVWGRTGFDLTVPWVDVPTGGDAGVRHVQIPELGRIELWLGGTTVRSGEPSGPLTGYLVANETLRDLPAGSHLDPTTGEFTWAPGPGYVGTYRLAFVQGGAQILVDVTIHPIAPADPGQSEVRMFIDTPSEGDVVSGSVTIAGWALDPVAGIGSGIDAVHVWAKGRAADAREDTGSDPAWREPGLTPSTSTPIFVGAATLGDVRPDVAQAFGPQFDRTGFGVTTSALAPGEYDFTVYVHSRRTARWEDARTVHVTVR